MVALPGQLFYNTQIPACLWFLARNKRREGSVSKPTTRDRRGETLFIDARKLGVLRDRLRNALETINPNLPASAIEDAIAHITRAESPSLIENNRRFHQFLTDGVDVEYQHNGRTKYEKVWLLDFDDPNNNDWLAVNQFTVIEGKHNRRPDIVVFINGLPIAVIELKNPIEENATIKGAFNQLQTYKNDIPCLFPFNEILIVSDGTEARVGTLTVDGDKITKKMAGYHQYHAVNKAVRCTVAATAKGGDRKVGVVWHTQGSGKSLTMTFYAGKIVQQPELANPTLVILTDRNDLDDQLFNTFNKVTPLASRRRPKAAEASTDYRVNAHSEDKATV